MSRELAVTLTLENDMWLQTKRVDVKGRVTYYFAMNDKMVLITDLELEALMLCIGQVLYSDHDQRRR